MPVRQTSFVRGALVSTVLVTVLPGCSDGPPQRPLGALAEPIVHGEDDRVEYFDARAPSMSRVAESAVVLVPKSRLNGASAAANWQAPTVGESAGLCAGEPFAEQPALAFCSGVLVDWDLVLTAGHCLRLLALDDFVAVLGYYYSAPGELDVAEGDVIGIAEIVADAVDPRGSEPRLDYGWLRLSEPARPPRRPAPIHASGPGALVGDPILCASSPGGVPVKLDAGAHVMDTRDAVLDYFVADTDTSHGSSGGGAFDADLALVGTLARGGSDYWATESGCNATVRAPGADSEEQFTYAFRAVSALCDTGAPTSLCRPDCGEPCEALPLETQSVAGCGFAPGTLSSGSNLNFGLALLGCLACVCHGRLGARREAARARTLARRRHALRANIPPRLPKRCPERP